MKRFSYDELSENRGKVIFYTTGSDEEEDWKMGYLKKHNSGFFIIELHFNKVVKEIYCTSQDTLDQRSLPLMMLCYKSALITLLNDLENTHGDDYADYFKGSALGALGALIEQVEEEQ